MISGPCCLSSLNIILYFLSQSFSVIFILVAFCKGFLLWLTFSYGRFHHLKRQCVTAYFFSWCNIDGQLFNVEEEARHLQWFLFSILFPFFIQLKISTRRQTILYCNFKCNLVVNKPISCDICIHPRSFMTCICEIASVVYFLFWRMESRNHGLFNR